MNKRENFLETVLFGNPERIPFSPGGARKSTLEKWYQQGLPKDVTDYTDYAYKQVGGTLSLHANGPGFPVNERMIPYFEEKVIEEREKSRVVQDWKGNICEIGKEFSTDYLRNAIDFVTRRWIKCPVENWEDWESMKTRYNNDDASRLPDNASELSEKLANRDWPVTLSFSGPFWQLREWLGFEQLCMAFYDTPDLVRDMITFWTEHVGQLLQRSFEYVTPDMVHISEDMAYKKFSMISPEMAREFLMPAWRTWGEMIREAGVPVYGVDSDGFIGELIPLWIESGVNCCDPIEVAAGNDINQMRNTFGHQIAFQGGVDKRCMAKGGQVIQDEMARLSPVIKDGGYIPSCDHGIPSDVSWPHFLEYVKLLAQATGWL